MRLAIALCMSLWCLSCAPRIPPPDQMAEIDEAVRARVQSHAEALRRDGHALVAPELEHTLALIRSEYGPKSPAVPQSLTDAALMLFEEGEMNAAVRYFERALQACEEAFGHEHLETSYALHDYAKSQVKAANGRYAPRARHYFEEALAVRRRVLGERHVVTAAGGLSLAEHLLASCRAEPPCDRSDRRLREALALTRLASDVFSKDPGAKPQDRANAAKVLRDLLSHSGSSQSEPLPPRFLP
jgi:tetratricopeptide (TPR) repeat protein